MQSTHCIIILKYAVYTLHPLLYCLFFQSMLHPKEGWNEKYVCHAPGYRVAKADTSPSQSGDEPEAYAATGNHLHNAAKHREVAEAKTLYGVAQDGEQSEDRVEVVGNAHKLCRMSHHLSLAAVYKEAHHPVGKGIDNDKGEDEVDQHKAYSVLHAL